MNWTSLLRATHRDAVPKQVALGGLNQQCPLTNGEFWCGADAGDAGSLSFDEVLVRALQLCEGRPFLAVPVHELAFILANRTIVRRFDTGRELRAAGRANPGLHRLAHRCTLAITYRSAWTFSNRSKSCCRNQAKAGQSTPQRLFLPMALAPMNPFSCRRGFSHNSL